MWTNDHDDDNDDSAMETETMYEDTVSMLSGVYHNAWLSFGFCVGLEF